MFLQRTFIALIFCSLIAACKNETPKAPVSQDLRVTIQRDSLRKCVRDTSCVEVIAEFPQLEGGTNAQALSAINDSLKKAALGDYYKLPLRQAIDSTIARLSLDLEEQLKFAEDPAYSMSYYDSSTGQIVWQSPKYVTSSYSYATFSGGAHGMYAVVLATYDLQTGRAQHLTDIISDTTALRPLLEKYIVKTKQAEDSTLNNLKEMLFEPELPVALPANFAVVKEGVSFVYNPYEIMAYAYGITEFTITWEELGKLADRNKWF
jgi:hypothetical protein